MLGSRGSFRRAGDKGRSYNPKQAVPTGAQVIPVSVKREYESVPFHVYHPTPYNAITILRKKEHIHDWLVCGWYLDTYKEGGAVTGLMYRQVLTQQDRDAVLSELRKHDKEANARFSLEVQ